MTANPEYRLFDLGTNPELTEAIAKKLKTPVSPVEIQTFADNEIYERIVDSVRGIDVYVIQPISEPVNDNFIKLMIFIDAAKRTSAKSINVIIPYLGYARSDRKTRSREPIVARLLADLMEDQGIRRVMTMDLHTSQVQGFFDIPVDHLIAMPVQAKYYEDRGLTGSDVVVVASGSSTLKLVQRLAEVLDAQWAIVDQDRDPRVKATVTGKVADKHAIILADIIDTGETMIKAADAVKAAGAKSIDALATHGVLSGHAASDLQESVIDHVVLTDTVPIPAEKHFDKLEVVSVAGLFAEAIGQVIAQKSMAKVLMSPDQREELS
ncbi:ribose-phosphate pyrophosphokinase [Fructobacillus pseudoficulneus]|uniref:ribose-phosphate diphosphokinase n=1 Tax=Fructobacillus pseudoficulneus TaxID=220714 RepID=A0A3F3H3P3_9LACO|nr:ribose-phosphate pyrophosphokinase [Fructobacillus pseudoficulneus]GAP02690.1 ribose-phosphate pyrophosphokinase [Fructobacillus pseudoficulneus]SEH39120.1 ribose-phosphate pyrophosphokinase [Fructobacillus pseudoficulneus]